MGGSHNNISSSLGNILGEIFRLKGMFESVGLRHYLDHQRLEGLSPDLVVVVLKYLHEMNLFIWDKSRTILLLFVIFLATGKSIDWKIFSSVSSMAPLDNI